MNYCSIPGCTTCKERKLADAVRLTADAVVKAADAWKVKRDARAFGGSFHAEDYARSCEILDDAVLAHRKAKEEASRG